MPQKKATAAKRTSGKSKTRSTTRAVFVAAQGRADRQSFGRCCLLIPGDVTESAFCRSAVNRTRRRYGRLDILVNKAALQQHQASLEDISDEQLDLTFRTNIFGYFYMARAALEHLPRGGAIINTGSITGLEGSKVAKHGGEVAMKRADQPEELAPAYVCFASEADFSDVTGEVLSVLGGDTTAG